MFQTTSFLFEMSVPEFKLVKQCRREVKMLKQLWDYMFLVRTCIDEWRTTMWVDVDVETMDMESKKFAKVRINFSKSTTNILFQSSDVINFHLTTIRISVLWIKI